MLLAHAGRAHRVQAARELAEVGLHPGQEFLLFALFGADGRPQVELANQLRVEPATMTKMLARVERVGLVERRPDPQDRRVSRVWLTAAGRRVEAPLRAAWARLESRTISDLSEAERGDLRRLLARVRQGLADEPGCARPPV